MKCYKAVFVLCPSQGLDHLVLVHIMFFKKTMGSGTSLSAPFSPWFLKKKISDAVFY